ncbi:YkvA family protein [Metabacillus sp. RGM 3146]|uniref:YkvA family protein n=1 Tax=Metabacillus sp. RGM 3146 TaxID=3401092 RepID=UPI003B9DBA05
MFNRILKKYAPRAKAYLNDKKKTEGLLKNAAVKASKNRGSLKSVWQRLTLLAEALKAWKTGEYPHFPRKSLIMIVIAILYFVTPLDFIPDFIFGFGILDDAAVIAFVVKQIGKDLNDFEKWKEQRDRTIDHTEVEK